jgi:hypothetical protein
MNNKSSTWFFFSAYNDDARTQAYHIAYIVHSLGPDGSTIKLLHLAHKMNFCILWLLQQPAIAFQTTFRFGFTLQ